MSSVVHLPELEMMQLESNQAKDIERLKGHCVWSQSLPVGNYTNILTADHKILYNLLLFGSVWVNKSIEVCEFMQRFPSVHLFPNGQACVRRVSSMCPDQVHLVSVTLCEQMF